MSRLLTATFIVHDPQPLSDEDWSDIHTTLEGAGNEVGLEMFGMVSEGHPDDALTGTAR